MLQLSELSFISSKTRSKDCMKDLTASLVEKLFLQPPNVYMLKPGRDAERDGHPSWLGETILMLRDQVSIENYFDFLP